MSLYGSTGIKTILANIKNMFVTKKDHENDLADKVNTATFGQAMSQINDGTVHKTGEETISGVKTFRDGIVIPIANTKDDNLTFTGNKIISAEDINLETEDTLYVRGKLNVSNYITVNDNLYLRDSSNVEYGDHRINHEDDGITIDGELILTESKLEYGIVKKITSIFDSEFSVVGISDIVFVYAIGTQPTTDGIPIGFVNLPLNYFKQYISETYAIYDGNRFVCSIEYSKTDQTILLMDFGTNISSIEVLAR